MRKEYWRPVVGYEGLYEVSNWGRVKRLARVVIRKNGRRYPVTEKILRPAANSDGYLVVHLAKDGKQITVQVHLLVWDAFVGENRRGLEVNHMDEDKNNCAVWNLNLLTHGDNVRWGTGIERRAKALTNRPDCSKPIIARNPATLEIIYEFPSTREAERNEFNRSAVGKACRGCYLREGNHTYKGLDWYYVNQ